MQIGKVFLNKMNENEDFLEDEVLLEDENSSDEENSGLFEHLNITVDKKQEPLRIDKFLLIYRQNSSRNKISQTCRAGNVIVNGNPVKQNYRVKPGDEISVLLTHPPRENVIIPEDIPINIVYEDDDVLVIDKEPGMVVHPGFGNWQGTLVNAVAFHFQKNGFTSDLDRVGLVHRIDKDTSGIIVLAKNEYALSFLAKQFFDRKTKRLYWAFVWGNLAEDAGTIKGHIGRHQKNRMQMAVYEDGSQGKHAVTHYKVIARYKGYTHIKCILETGRTHQIRVHMAYLGHPVSGDLVYGVKNEKVDFTGQCLHARKIGFVHPRSGEYLEFTSQLPEYFRNYLEKLDKITK